jgi:hypothetical protein
MKTLFIRPLERLVRVTEEHERAMAKIRRKHDDNMARMKRIEEDLRQIRHAAKRAAE